jgi:hypothetical protein
MTGLNVVTLGLAILALVTHAGILFGVTRLTRQKLLLSTPASGGVWSDKYEERRDRRRTIGKRFALRSRTTWRASACIPIRGRTPGLTGAIRCARDLINQIFGYQIIQQPNRGRKHLPGKALSCQRHADNSAKNIPPAIFYFLNPRYKALCTHKTS